MSDSGGDREVKKAVENDVSTSDVEVDSCPICFEEIPDAENERYIIAGCLHKVCVECMRDHLSYLLKQRKSVTCPIPECKCEIQAEQCNMLLDADQMTLLKLLNAEARIPVAQRVYCPKPRCSFLMSSLELRPVDSALPGARQCQECGSRFCLNCKMDWHNRMSCAQFQKTKAYTRSATAVFDALAQGLGLKKCRNCGCTVERVEGCKHMTCPFCKFEFCYNCGNPWIKRKPTCRCAH